MINDDQGTEFGTEPSTWSPWSVYLEMTIEIFGDISIHTKVEDDPLCFFASVPATQLSYPLSM
jgi:hypothetical protein